MARPGAQALVAAQRQEPLGSLWSLWSLERRVPTQREVTALLELRMAAEQPLQAALQAPRRGLGSMAARVQAASEFFFQPGLQVL